MARFVEGGIDSRERAESLMDFLLGVLPPLCPARQATEGLHDWRSDRLVRRGMAEDVLRTLTPAMAYLQKKAPGMKAAIAMRAQTLNSVGLSRMIERLDVPRIRRPPPFNAEAAFRLWKASLRASCHLVPRIGDLAGTIRATGERFRERGRLEDARQLETWVLHREISERYRAGDLAGIRGIAERLKGEVAAIPPDDLRVGATGMQHALYMARMHVDPDPVAVASDLRALEGHCLGAGNLLLASRLRSYRVHLLLRIGREEEARSISLGNVATRIVIRDRSGVQFALNDLARMEAGRGTRGERFAAALLALAADLGAVTRDYAARVAGGHHAERPLPPEGRADWEEILRNMPYISRADLLALVNPPVDCPARPAERAATDKQLAPRAAMEQALVQNE